MGKNIIILNGDELRRLAKLVHYQEVENVQKINFKSEAERRKHLNQSKACYKSALGLLDNGEKLKSDYEHDEKKSNVAHEIFNYMEWTVNSSFQFVLSYKVRMDCIGNAVKYSQTLIKRLQVLDPNDSSGVLKLLADAKQYEKAMVELAKEQSHPFVSGVSSYYNRLSTWMKSEQITFESLLLRFKNKLGFEGPFKNLAESEKTQVFEKILEASGRGRAIAAGVARCLGAAGVVCLIATAGVMVWDVYTSDHKLQTAVHDTVVIAALMAGVYVGRFAVTALLEWLAVDVAVCGIALGPVGIFVGSIVVASILSGLAGWAVDKLFDKFSHQEESHPTQHPVATTPLPQPVVAPTPDARAIAYQIAHRRSWT